MFPIDIFLSSIPILFLSHIPASPDLCHLKCVKKCPQTFNPIIKAVYGVDHVTLCSPQYGLKKKPKIQNIKSLPANGNFQSNMQTSKSATNKTRQTTCSRRRQTTTYPNDDTEKRHIILKQGMSSYRSQEVRCWGQESL